MEIAIVLLAFVLFAVLIWCYLLMKKCDNLIDVVADLSLHAADREDWENGTFERYTKRLDTASKEIERIKAEKEAHEKKLSLLEDRVKDFDELAEESVKARIDADKAWAVGVQSLASYGMNVPRLNTEDLNNG